MTIVAGVMSVRAFLERVFERREVDERLEHRSGLPARVDGAVELRLVVGAAPDHREDLAGARIDGDERRLRLLPLALGEQFVDANQPVAHGVLREALQVQVERRVDVDGAGDRAVLVLQLLADVVDEVGRLGLERAGDDLHRFLRRAVGGLGAHEPGVRHRLQHDVAALLGPIGMDERRMPRRRLDDAGDERRLAQRHVRDVLGEEQPRRFGHAVHGERAALAEPHVVQIELEDLILAQPALEDERHELILHLADRAPFLREERVLDELLRQRAAAAQVRLAAGRVVPDRRRDADGIDADVVVEPPVLDREDRLRPCAAGCS